MAEATEVRLAKKIVTILRSEDRAVALKALQLARILLPSAADIKRAQKKKQDREAEDESAGALVSADQEISRFSRAMGRPTPTLEVEEGPDLS